MHECSSRSTRRRVFHATISPSCRQQMSVLVKSPVEVVEVVAELASAASCSAALDGDLVDRDVQGDRRDAGLGAIAVRDVDEARAIAAAAGCGRGGNGMASGHERDARAVARSERLTRGARDWAPDDAWMNCAPNRTEPVDDGDGPMALVRPGRSNGCRRVVLRSAKARAMEEGGQRSRMTDADGAEAAGAQPVVMPAAATRLMASSCGAAVVVGEVVGRWWPAGPARGRGASASRPRVTTRSGQKRSPPQPRVMPAAARRLMSSSWAVPLSSAK